MIIVPRKTILPPPRPGVRHVPLPLIGILIADDELRDRMERQFHWPMIILALLVLPLIGLEFFLVPKMPERRQELAQAVIVVTEIAISLAFLVEFVVKIAIAESRFEYVRRNWLDLVVICLPLLRMIRVLRLARVAKTSRMFRLRGVGMKFARHILTMLLGLNITDRLLERFGVKLHSGRKDPTQMTRYQLQDELRRRRREVDRWRTWHEAYQKHVARYGGDPLPDPPTEEVETLDPPPADQAEGAAEAHPSTGEPAC